MVSKEDSIKIPIYIEFQKQYFSARTDKKTKFIQLSQKERSDFCYQQKIYVEEEYQKQKYDLK